MIEQLLSKCEALGTWGRGEGEGRSEQQEGGGQRGWWGKRDKEEEENYGKTGRGEKKGGGKKDMWISFKLWLWLLTEVMSLEKTDSHSHNKYQLLIAPQLGVYLHRHFSSPSRNIDDLSFINSK